MKRKIEERAAVVRIAGLQGEQQADGLLELWQEFETGTTPESRFANAQGRAMPVILNLNNKGQSWRENDISYERVVGRVLTQISKGCPGLWLYLERRIYEARESGYFAPSATV